MDSESTQWRAVQPSCKGDGAPFTFRPIPPLHELDREPGQNLGPGSAEQRALVASVSEQPPLRSAPVRRMVGRCMPLP